MIGWPSSLLSLVCKSCQSRVHEQPLKQRTLKRSKLHYTVRFLHSVCWIRNLILAVMAIAGGKSAQVTQSKKFQSSRGLVSTVSNKRNNTATDLNLILCCFWRKSCLHFNRTDSHCNNNRSRLEKTFKITKSNHQPDLLNPVTKPYPLVSHPHIS